MFIYPNKGQSQKQLEQDKFACHEWAVQQSGFDPANPQVGQTAPPPAMHSAGGGVLRGGARGAAIGAVGGAIAGDAGKGAAIGAATGGLFGGMRQRAERRREAEVQAGWSTQQAMTSSSLRQAYDRAMKACLSGRGYTVG
jgi:hypothetical protein